MSPKSILFPIVLFTACEPTMPKGDYQVGNDSAPEDSNTTDSAEDPSDDTDSPTDPIDPDTGSDTDTDTDTGADTDTGEPPEQRITCQNQAQFVTPIDFEFFKVGDPIDATVQMDPLTDYTGYSIRWEDSAENEIGLETVSGTGDAIYAGTDFTQTKGLNRVYARLVTPEGICDTRAEKPISVCQNELVETF